MTQLRSSLLVVAVLLAAGCSTGPAPSYSTSSGSLALSRDDAFLYAADSDNNVVVVVDRSAMQVIAKVAVGQGPERIAIGSDDTIYVGNRSERTVSVIQRGEWVEAARIPVGVEPVGLAVSPDAKTLYVVNATSLQDPSTGTVMAIDTASRSLLWDLPVGEEPRGIALLSNGTLAVTLYKQGDLVVVDPSVPAVVINGTSLNVAANTAPQSQGNISGAPVPQGGGADPAGFGGSGQETFHSRGMASVTVAPDGRTLYAPVVWSSNAIIPLESTVSEVLPADAGTGGVDPCEESGGGAYGGGGGGGCGPIMAGGKIDPNPPGGPVVLPGLATFDGNSAQPKVDFVASRGSQVPDTANYPASVLHVEFAGQQWQEPVQEPVAAVVDPSNDFLFVVNRASNNVAVLSTTRKSASSTVNSGGGCNGCDFNSPPPNFNSEAQQPWVSLASVGAGPTGIALTRDATHAYVYNAFDHSISTLVSDGSNGVVVQGPALVVGADTLPADQAAGRRMFFSAVDPSVTAMQVSMSCGSCHLEGREDGHVWQFMDGPRQTMALVGRMLDQTAPYHWSGALPSIGRFMDVTITQRMGGTGLSLDQDSNLAKYLVAAPLPDNPFRGAALNASQQRGALVFQMANCNSCHTGAALTNNGFASVGSASTNPTNPDDLTNMPQANEGPVQGPGFNVPSLLGVARTAPYLHSGEMATLKDRIEATRGNNTHGNLTSVTDSMVDDLVAYLQTL